MRHLGRSWDRHDPRLLREQPSERDLRRSSMLALAPLFDELHELQVVRQILGREPGLNTANITLGEARIPVDGTGVETHAKWAPRDETDAKLVAQRDDLLLRATPQHRIFVLHGG